MACGGIELLTKKGWNGLDCGKAHLFDEEIERIDGINKVESWW